MSDVEGEVSTPAPAPAAAPAGGPMDLNTAIQEVLKQAYIADGLARGIRQAAQALDRRQALLCLLANNVDAPGYSQLIEALCQEHQIRLLKVDSSKTLGEWAGLCKYDKEGNARKVVACSCLVVTDYGGSTSSQAHSIIENYFKSK
uniref:40S ribosomal protein S12 n=1 Tax=Hirondellea gigas TaxID=1518452 RepID=A0A2P2HWW9_9CRUS